MLHYRRLTCCCGALAATLVLACGMPAFGGKPPAISYQILQLDLQLELENSQYVTYARSDALDISSPSASTIPRQVVGYVAQDDTTESCRPACWTISIVGGIVQSQLQVLAPPTGTVCGAAETSNPLLQAVVWTGGTKLALKGAKFYITRYANDINDQGVIVGWSEYTKNLSGTSHAVMWSSATGSMVLLNQFLDDNLPLTTLSWANAVNNYGEIVGFGYAGPLYRAFLAIPK